MVNATDLAAVLRAARLDAGLTQHTLARRAGLTQSTVARAERGSRLTWPTAVQLLAAMGLQRRLGVEKLGADVERALAEVAATPLHERWQRLDPGCTLLGLFADAGFPFVVCGKAAGLLRGDVVDAEIPEFGVPDEPDVLRCFSFFRYATLRARLSQEPWPGYYTEETPLPRDGAPTRWEARLTLFTVRLVPADVADRCIRVVVGDHAVWVECPDG